MLRYYYYLVPGTQPHHPWGSRLGPLPPGPPGALLALSSDIVVLDEYMVFNVLLAASLGESIGMAAVLGVDSPGILVSGLYAYGAITEAMMILADNIVDNCGFNPEEYAGSLAGRASLDNPLRMYDPGTAEVLLKVRRGVPWWVAREQVSTPSSRLDAAARGVPVVLFYSNRRLAATMAVAQALVTHVDERDLEAARLYALALHTMLYAGVKPDEVPLLLMDETDNSLLRELLARIPDLLDEPEQRAAKLLLLSPCKSPHPLGVALYTALRYNQPSIAARHAATICGQSNNAVPAASMAAVLALVLSNGELGGDRVIAEKLEAYDDLRRRAAALRWAALKCRSQL